MYTDILKNFTDLTEQSRAALEPVQKYNQLVIENFEKMTALQLSAARFYAELNIEQLKAVSEIKDLPSLTSYQSKQVELINTLTEKVAEDNARLQEQAKSFQSDVQELITTNVKKAAKATKAA